MTEMFCEALAGVLGKAVVMAGGTTGGGGGEGAVDDAN